MNDKSVYDEQQKLSFIELFVELPNFLAVTATAILTQSLISWMDFVDSLGNVLSSGFVAVLSKKLKRNLKYEYNYGIGKIEAIASLCCELFVIFGLISVCIFSVMEIMTPKKPSELLFYAVLLKVVNVGFDTYFLVKQRKLTRGGSRLAKSEYKACVHDFTFDLIALLALIVCYAFREIRAVWYLAPALCLAASVFFFIGGAGRIRAAIAELTDKTLPEREQLLILKAINSRNNDYSKLISVNSHYSGDRVLIDLHVSFEADTSYGEIEEFRQRVANTVRSELPNSVVSIMISD